MDKIKVFETEFDYIENDALKTLAQKFISQLPNYFFSVAASSTGKYHPKYTQGEGGLVRHVKAAVRIAVELLRLEMYSSLLPAKDYIIIALLLHDGWKHGPQTEDGSYNQYTTFDHPKVAADWVRNSCLADTAVLEYIAGLIESHMGEWNQNPRTGAIDLPKPQTQEQCFVHLCDYLASRKAFEFNENEPFVS